MRPDPKNLPPRKASRKTDGLPTALNLPFPGRSVLTPRKHRDLESGLQKEVVKTIDETFGRD